MSERLPPAPLPSPETQPFWDAAAEGRFLVRWCADCERAHWYPRTICPLCMSDRTEWRAGSGKGSIYSFSVMRAVATPYAIAYVTLDEGPTMMTNIVDCSFDAIAIGRRVRLVLKPSDGGPPLPMFTPE